MTDTAPDNLDKLNDHVHADQGPLGDSADESDESLAGPPTETQLPQDWGRLGRIRDLSDQIKYYPDSPSNYVYRGELLLQEDIREQAIDDFQRAIALAESQAESANWGYINSALADRAREWLRRLGEA